MSLSTAPYISFPGTTAEAMAFYQALFGGELEVLTYEGVPTEGFPVKPGPDAVAHASLTGGALDLRAGDSLGDDLPEVRSNVYSILVMVDTKPEGDDLIARFTDAGGTIEMPFAPAPWGDTYGVVRDNFDVSWQIFSPGTA